MRPPPGGFFFMELKMAPITVRVEVRLRWWVRPYLATLGALCELLGREPDEKRVAATVARGVRVFVR